MPRFADKVAVITGSSFGIGRSTALLFAKEGARVTITGRNPQRLEETHQALLSAGIPNSHIHSVIADITSAQGQDLLIQSTLEKFGGRIDILINNAGAAIPDAEKRQKLEQGIDTFQKMIDLNVQSVIEMTQKIRPHLAKSQGEIVNISSIAGCPVANVKKKPSWRTEMHLPTSSDRTSLPMGAPAWSWDCMQCTKSRLENNYLLLYLSLFNWSPIKCLIR